MVAPLLPVLAGGLVASAGAAAQAGSAAVARARPAGLAGSRGALYSVGALPGGAAWAVGSAGVCHPKTLIARRNGAAWTAVPVPAGARRGQLFGTAVTSADNAW